MALRQRELSRACDRKHTSERGCAHEAERDETRRDETGSDQTRAVASGPVAVRGCSPRPSSSRCFSEGAWRAWRGAALHCTALRAWVGRSAAACTLHARSRAAVDESYRVKLIFCCRHAVASCMLAPRCAWFCSALNRSAPLPVQGFAILLCCRTGELAVGLQAFQGPRLAARGFRRVHQARRHHRTVAQPPQLLTKSARLGHRRGCSAPAMRATTMRSSGARRVPARDRPMGVASPRAGEFFPRSFGFGLDYCTRGREKRAGRIGSG